MASPPHTGLSRFGGFVAGAALSFVGTVVCYLFVVASDLTNYEFFDGLLVGTGLLCFMGLVLALTRSYRWIGVGLLVAAPVAFLIEWVVLILLIMSVTY